MKISRCENWYIGLKTRSVSANAGTKDSTFSLIKDINNCGTYNHIGFTQKLL